MGSSLRNPLSLLLHDEENKCNEGDMVKIMETRKLSKNKNWRLVDIIERQNNDTARIKSKSVSDNSGQKKFYVLEF